MPVATPPTSRQSFNPRPCARGDIDFVDPKYYWRNSFRFQSAPLREGRPVGLGNWIDAVRFQSAPLREGRHTNATVKSGLENVSIRAPARGATFTVKIRNVDNFIVSIRAPARGATQPDGDCLVGCDQFQSAPLREGRRGAYTRSLLPGCVSIRAPARGATGRVFPQMLCCSCFNPRPCARGDELVQYRV